MCPHNAVLRSGIFPITFRSIYQMCPMPRCSEQDKSSQRLQILIVLVTRLHKQPHGERGL